MGTILLEVNDDKAYRLIEDLAAMNIVTVLEKDPEPKVKLSEKYRGALKLSREEYQQMQDALLQGRNEWERNI